MDDETQEDLDESAWPINVAVLARIAQILAPAALLSMLLGKSGVFLDFLLNYNFIQNQDVKTRPNRKFLLWLLNNVPVASCYGQSLTEQDIWRDGSILCSVINAIVPDACPNPQNHYRQPPIHGQRLAHKYLNVKPMFTNADFNRLTPYQIKKFNGYLKQIHNSIIYRNDPTTMKISTEYIVRGMGLIIAYQNTKAYFYIYPVPKLYLQNCDVTVTIKGPYNAFGTVKIPSISNYFQKFQSTDYKRALYFSGKLNSVSPTTQGTSFFRILSIKTTTNPDTDILIKVKVSENRAKITYIPLKPGIYEISLMAKGYHIVGSPYTVPVEMSKNPNQTSNESDSEIEDKSVVKNRKQKIRSKIIDFIDEQMVLNDDGSLVKCNDEKLNQKYTKDVITQKENNSVVSNKVLIVSKNDKEMMKIPNNNNKLNSKKEDSTILNSTKENIVKQMKESDLPISEIINIQQLKKSYENIKYTKKSNNKNEYNEPSKELVEMKNNNKLNHPEKLTNIINNSVELTSCLPIKKENIYNRKINKLIHQFESKDNNISKEKQKIEANKINSILLIENNNSVHVDKNYLLRNDNVVSADNYTLQKINNTLSRDSKNELSNNTNKFNINYTNRNISTPDIVVETSVTSTNNVDESQNQTKIHEIPSSKPEDVDCPPTQENKTKMFNTKEKVKINKTFQNDPDLVKCHIREDPFLNSELKTKPKTTEALPSNLENSIQILQNTVEKKPKFKPFEGIVKNHKKIFDTDFSSERKTVVLQKCKSEGNIFPSSSWKTDEDVMIPFPSVQERKTKLLKNQKSFDSFLNNTPVENSNNSNKYQTKEIKMCWTQEINKSDSIQKPSTTCLSVKRKARFNRAKIYFQSLETIQYDNKKEIESSMHLTPKQSQCDTSDVYLLGNFQLKPPENKTTNITDRFFVDDLYRDILGDSDKFIGIPNKTAVVASLASLENQTTKLPEVFVPQENVRKDYHEEYPHPPMTNRNQYQSRSNRENSGLIPRRIILSMKGSSF